MHMTDLISRCSAIWCTPINTGPWTVSWTANVNLDCVTVKNTLAFFELKIWGGLGWNIFCTLFSDFVSASSSRSSSLSLIPFVWAPAPTPTEQSSFNRSAVEPRNGRRTSDWRRFLVNALGWGECQLECHSRNSIQLTVMSIFWVKNRSSLEMLQSPRFWAHSV